MLNTKMKQVAFLAVGVSCMLLASGCIVQDTHQPPPPPHAVYVQTPPPADIVEYQSPPPDSSPYWAWQKGHWRWNGRAYYWTPGHWVHRPPHYTMWVAPHWEARGNGWFFIEGHWQ